MEFRGNLHPEVFLWTQNQKETLHFKLFFFRLLRHACHGFPHLLHVNQSSAGACGGDSVVVRAGLVKTSTQMISDDNSSFLSVSSFVFFLISGLLTFFLCVCILLSQFNSPVCPQEQNSGIQRMANLQNGINSIEQRCPSKSNPISFNARALISKLFLKKAFYKHQKLVLYLNYPLSFFYNTFYSLETHSC